MSEACCRVKSLRVARNVASRIFFIFTWFFAPARWRKRSWFAQPWRANAVRKTRASRLGSERHNFPRASIMGAEAGRERRADEASGSARRIEVEDVKALFAEQKGHLDYFFDEVRARLPFDPFSTSSPTTRPN